MLAMCRELGFEMRADRTMPRWSGSARSWPDADGLRWNALTIQQPHRLISIARDPAGLSLPSPARAR